MVKAMAASQVAGADPVVGTESMTSSIYDERALRIRTDLMTELMNAGFAQVAVRLSFLAENAGTHRLGPAASERSF
jgi:hypothetical protein